MSALPIKTFRHLRLRSVIFAHTPFTRLIFLTLNQFMFRELRFLSVFMLRLYQGLPMSYKSQTQEALLVR